MRVSGELTCTKAVDMMTPVPNCFKIVKVLLLERTRVKRIRRIGEKTAIANQPRGSSQRD